MSSYIDLKYINNISGRLEQFKKRGEYLYNFRCPHCGDSKKSKSKARAYLYRVKNDMFFKCHNCGEGQNLANFLKYVDQKSYDNYILERYKSSAPATPKPTFDFKPPVFKSNVLKDCKKISELDKTHPALEYIFKRKLPVESYELLYISYRFQTLVNEVKPNTFTISKDHPRLIIPFYDTTGKLFAFQGRAFGNEQPKYLTIKLDENKQKIYGLERINFQKHINIVEGPLDSLFLDNCLAAAGADLKLSQALPENVTYIFDNEPRNKEIIKRMYKAIDDGYNLVIWPEDIKEKDINDMIISGLTKQKINDIIKQSTYSGLSALTNLNYWKKIKGI